MKQFLITCIVTLILILGIVNILQYYLSIEIILTPFYYTTTFVMLITILFHLVLIKTALTNSKQFINRFLAASGLKILLYLVVIVTFIFANKLHAKAFLISFLISYSVYTFIEVYFILKFLKKITP
jgi:hypothetical protein